MDIIKRNGEKQEFKRSKIINALNKANASVKNDDKLKWEQIEFISKQVEDYCKTLTSDATVEDIQDYVEKCIMAEGAFTLAKNYITYRYLHALARDQYKDLMDKVAEKLTAKNVVNQNANVDEFSFGGRTGETASVITKEYALKYLMSDKARTAHEDNTIYTHDLDSYSIGDHNCLTCPIDYLLKYGFTTRQTDVRPARSINTAFQLVAVIFQLQSLQQFGGVSAGHLDSTMVPYIRISFFKHFKDGIKYLYDIDTVSFFFDNLCREHNLDEQSSITAPGYKAYPKAYEYAKDMTEKECRQAVEGLLHNLSIWVA